MSFDLFQGKFQIQLIEYTLTIFWRVFNQDKEDIGKFNKNDKSSWKHKY